MAVPYIKNSFVSGELSPELWGRTDLTKFSSSASTMRNMYVNYRGGANSRAGTAFVGYSKQTGNGDGLPPRLIPFQFSTDQGLVLEFGDEYMRVISDGAFITEAPLAITGITNSSPAVLSVTATGTTGATPVNTNVVSSYATGDIVTIAGGTFTTPATLQVLTTELLSTTPSSAGTGYAPGDTIHTSGGTYSIQPIVTVSTTSVTSLPTIVNAGTGGTPGTATVTGTTGTGTKFQAIVTISSSLSATENNGAVTSSYAPGDSITFAGGTLSAGGSPAVVQVISAALLSLTPVISGSGYAPGNTVTLGGGATTAAPIAAVATTTVSALPTIASAGTGGTPGTATVTGTTGTGTKFQASVTISAGGSISSVNSLTVAGSYTVNPTMPSNEPVTGGSLSGAALALTMGIGTVTISSSSPFTANPSANTFTQAATSGSGTGATFLGLFGVSAVTFTSNGQYSVFPSNPVAQAATSGSGYGVTFTASNSSGITAVNSLTVAGSYTVNPTSPASAPVTGGGLTGATLGLVMGIGTVTVTTAGSFTANPSGGVLTQASTSGSGTGAIFGYSVFAPLTVSVIQAGTYSVYPTNPASQGSTSGSGVGAEFNLTSGAAASYNNGDWVYLSGIGGMTELNGRTVVVGSATSTSFAIFDVFGNAIDTTSYPAFTSGGTAARIYTLTTPYAAVDLPYLKYTQSADVMSLCCWNQVTLTEYAPMELTRFADNNWTIAPASFGAGISAPGALTAGVSSPLLTFLQLYVVYYYVTAVDATTNEESDPIGYYNVNGPLGQYNSNGNPSKDQVFSDTLNWSQVKNATYYNVYAESAVPLSSPTPPGSSDNTQWPAQTFIAGLIGQTVGTTFVNNGIAPDFAKGIPQHNAPFSRGAIIAAPIKSGGSGYNRPFVTNATITTSTGSGAVLTPLYTSPGHNIGSVYIQNAGANYQSGDTVAISGGGTGATASLTIGSETGTYPGVVAYFQERRVYASTQNNPDTYWLSQVGLYLNFDTHFPAVASDAITGSPWAVEVNGIQWMVNMPGGLVILTGLGAWQLTGAGGSSLNPVPITPAQQQAQPQAFNGVSPTVQPIKIDYQLIYVQAKGSIVREFTYQIYLNVYTGIDMTEISSQLFSGYTIDQWAYAEEPLKIIWAVRNDGVLLSLTYLKAENVSAWARHDTNGLYVGVASITEPPVDAVYLATQRTIGGNTSYMIERMDNRLWQTAEQSWCVDAGLTTALSYPSATLTASSPIGKGAISGVTNLVGGSGYSAGTYAVIIDANGNGVGSGAVATLSISSGVITSVTIAPHGSNYSYPTIVFIDPAGSAGGSGASATCVLDNSANFSASFPVFTSGNVGNIIRMGGGMAKITAFVSSTAVVANILVPITKFYPNSGNASSFPIVIPQPAGSWSLGTPYTSIGGLFHLIGATVTGVADGNVIPPQIVAADGTITLSTPASLVTVGLGFTSQLQGVYFDAGGQATSQGRRKRIAAATCRLELSRDVLVGSNQPDGSALSPQQIAPDWSGLTQLPNLRIPTFNGICTPLYTGDMRIPVPGNMDTRGQIALEQSNPLPMNVSAVIAEVLDGDVEAGKDGMQPCGGGNGVSDTGFYFLNVPNASIDFVAPPASAISNTPTAFAGDVTPAGSPVQIAFGTSSITPPVSGWVDAVVTGTSWAATVTPYI